MSSGRFSSPGHLADASESRRRPCLVGAQAPVIAIDGSGNAVVAWSGAPATTVLGPIFTASLPAGGSWTAVKTLDATGCSTVRVVANATGSAIITWSDDDNIWADSGTILGGFATPVDVGHALAHYHSPRISFVALNNAGQAVVAYGATGMAAIRSASGTWSGAMALPCGREQYLEHSGSIDQRLRHQRKRCRRRGRNLHRRLVTTVTVNNTAVETVNAFTSPPGGTFGTATTFPVTLFDNLDLNIAAGRATLVWNGSSGAFESTESVS